MPQSMLKSSFPKEKVLKYFHKVYPGMDTYTYMSTQLMGGERGATAVCSLYN